MITRVLTVRVEATEEKALPTYYGAIPTIVTRQLAS
jgi:hypothetical protein